MSDADLESSALADAVELAAAELKKARQYRAGLENDLRAARERETRLEMAVSSMIAALPENLQERYKPRRPAVESPPDNPIQAILNMMIVSDKDTFRVEEVQRFLDEKGFCLSPGYASNTLKRLYERGDLVRLGRGQYRLNTTHLAIEGFIEEDYN